MYVSCILFNDVITFDAKRKISKGDLEDDDGDTNKAFTVLNYTVYI
jgi:hypothetical protein